jgi:predicted dehydrogenase
MVRENLRVAVVGLGKMGLVHSGVLNVLPNVELTAVCEKSSLIRRFSKKIFKGTQIVEDVRDLAKLDLDAIFVTTPIPSHFAIAKTLYSEGVVHNIFVEKTLAGSYEEARGLCELANTFGGTNMVGYLRRFYVTFEKARDLLSQDAIGDVSSFKAYAYSSDFSECKKAVSERAALRGGVLKDLGCHAIDLALWFFGDLHCSSPDLASPVDAGPCDLTSFEVTRTGGLIGKFDISWCMSDYRMAEVGFSIEGSEGMIEVDDDKVELRLNSGRSSVWYRHDLQDNVSFWLGLPEYYREDLHFIKSVIGSCDAEPNFDAGSKVDRIIGQVKQTLPS